MPFEYASCVHNDVGLWQAEMSQCIFPIQLSSNVHPNQRALNSYCGPVVVTSARYEKIREPLFSKTVQSKEKGRHMS